MGEGDYAADVAIYEGDARARDLKTEADLLDYDADVATWGAGVTRYNAEVANYGVALSKHGAENTRYQATLDRRSADHIKWYGGTVLQEGSRSAQALYAAADRTESTSYLTAGLNGLSIAAKYAPSFMGRGSSGYALSRDTARTAGDADLAGYGGVRAGSDYGGSTTYRYNPDGMVA
jgi:hypothetical protein